MKYKYIERDNIDHIQDMINEELNNQILKIGALLSILINSKANQTKLLINILKDDEFRECVLSILEMDDCSYLIRHLISAYPSLSRSKIVTGFLKNRQNEQHLEHRKKYL